MKKLILLLFAISAGCYAQDPTWINGALVPGSSPCVGTNSLGQLVPATCSGSGGSGTVTSVSTTSWPSWLHPSVATPTVTPAISVTADPIPNASLLNAVITVNGVTCTLGAGCTAGITALTGDGTASGNGSSAFTLATVNSNVGTFGSTTNCVTLTVNAKGLVTAISQAACAGGGGGSGVTITTVAGLPGTCPAAGLYLATDAPLDQNIYTCSGASGAPSQLINLGGGSGCLSIIAGTLDIVSTCVPNKTAANDMSALNRFGMIAGMGASPTRTNVAGTVAVNASSTNMAGTLTSSTSGTVTFTFTLAGVTLATRPVCMFGNETTRANIIGTTQSTPPTTSALTVTGTTVSGDIISYICSGY